MECSWGERVYYLACSPRDKLSISITSISNSLQVSISTQSTGQSSLYSDSVSNSLLPTGVEAVAQ